MTTHSNPVSRKTLILLTVIAVIVAACLAIGLVILSLRCAPTVAEPSSASGIPTTAATTAAPTTTGAETTTTTAISTTTTKPVYTFKELTFSSPSKTTLTTTESSISFLGSADPAFPLMMNGNVVMLSSLGGFSLEEPLKIGLNTFTFKSNDKTVTYRITYKQQVLKSVTPSAALSVEGNSSVQFSAVARKKSAVKLVFNGKSITMKPGDEGNEEAADDQSDFTTYVGTMTMPTAKAGQKQSLGTASITATFNGLTETRKTGAITVLPGANTNLVAITADYAETFSGAAVNDYSRPVNAYLPKGTIDQVIKTGTAAGHNYYLLGCGRWVYTSDAQPTTAMKTVTNTKLTGGTVNVNEKATVLTLEAGWKIPYNVVLGPQTYEAPNATPPSYAISKQTTQYVDLTFYYILTHPDAPDMSGSPLFRASEWRTDSAGNPVLRLTLRNTAAFYGYSVKWNGSILTFSFKHPTAVKNNSDAAILSGVRIVVDPGHGGSSSGTYGTIKGLYEKTLTLDYSLILRNKLQALGATVDMTRTTDILPDNPTMATRTAHARNNHTDLLLSVHMNGSTSANASGCTLHYFNEYSRGIAGGLTDQMRAVEKKYGIGNRQVVTTWSPFFMARVHDCPAVLIECGFMTNAANMAKLVDNTYIDEMTDAIVRAVVNYFRSLPQFEIAPPTEPTQPTEPVTEPTVPTQPAGTE